MLNLVVGREYRVERGVVVVVGEGRGVRIPRIGRGMVY